MFYICCFENGCHKKTYSTALYIKYKRKSLFIKSPIKPFCFFFSFLIFVFFFQVFYFFAKWNKRIYQEIKFSFNEKEERKNIQEVCKLCYSLKEVDRVLYQQKLSFIRKYIPLSNLKQLYLMDTMQLFENWLHLS